MNLKEINCAGWFFMTASVKDTLETKKQIVAHNERYIENCTEKGNARD